MYKFIFTAALACSAIFFTACEDDLVTLSFDMNGPVATYLLKSDDVKNSNGVPVSISTPAESTDVPELKEQGVDLSKLESAKLKELKVSIESPTTGNFSFVKEVKFYLIGKGIAETLVASKSNIDATATSVMLDLTDTELVDFIKSGEVSTRVSFTTSSGIDEDYTMKANLKYAVKAKP
jgi:hypothetical protein